MRSGICFLGGGVTLLQALFLNLVSAPSYERVLTECMGWCVMSMVFLCFAIKFSKNHIIKIGTYGLVVINVVICIDSALRLLVGVRVVDFLEISGRGVSWFSIGFPVGGE